MKIIKKNPIILKENTESQSLLVTKFPLESWMFLFWQSGGGTVRCNFQHVLYCVSGIDGLWGRFILSYSNFI